MGLVRLVQPPFDKTRPKEHFDPGSRTTRSADELARVMDELIDQLALSKEGETLKQPPNRNYQGSWPCATKPACEVLNLSSTNCVAPAYR